MPTDTLPPIAILGAGSMGGAIARRDCRAVRQRTPPSDRPRTAPREKAADTHAGLVGVTEHLALAGALSAAQHGMPRRRPTSCWSA